MCCVHHCQLCSCRCSLLKYTVVRPTPRPAPRRPNNASRRLGAAPGAFCKGQAGVGGWVMDRSKKGAKRA
jgi:hypothetical protein